MSEMTPEGYVKVRCLNVLKQWEVWGIVLDYDDVSGLGKHLNQRTNTWTMHTKKGKRDLIAWFKVGRVLWTYLVECKSDVGVQSPHQIEYENKFKGLSNVVYEVVSEPKQIHITLDRLTGRSKELFRQADEHMFPTKRSGIWLKRKRSTGTNTKEQKAVSTQILVQRSTNVRREKSFGRVGIDG